jgi:predicted alpha-1,2-mannosidase
MHARISPNTGARGTHRRLPAAAGLVLALFLVPSGIARADAAPAATRLPLAATDPAALVDPFIGTGNGGKVAGDVDTFPGAAVPFGMLTWSPTTPSRPAGGDYAYKDSTILGFSLTHISGPGCSAAGEVPILPTTGAIGMRPDTASEPFEHAHEHAVPGAYQVTLAPGTPSAIDASLATTMRTGIGRFRFPATSRANFVIKVSDAQMHSQAAAVRIIGDREVAGMETSGHFCGSASDATLYFVARFDQPFRAFGTWQGAAVRPGSRASAGGDTGAWVSFDATRQRAVTLKVAISYVSEADAWANLRAEDAGWNLAAVAAGARADWNGLLSRIVVDGGTHDQQVQFYSALYHVLLHPNVFSDVNGEYVGFDFAVHHLPAGQAWQFANFSGWDIYRSEIPLLALLAPHRVGDMVRSLLNDQAQGRWLPKWGYDNDYTGVMNGDPADAIIAEAYAFGARGFDAHKALAAMVRGATRTSDPSTWSGGYVERPNLRDYERLGYVPGNASETLEYAVADFAVARLAQSLGDSATHATFLARSQDWQNIFDGQARFRGYAGYVEPRAEDGSFASDSGFEIRPRRFGQSGFEEGNTIQYTWMVPQDLHGLIEAMGGNGNAVARLDTLFTELNVGPDQPYYWAGNEPALTMPWIYDYAGAPYRAQAVVHRLITDVYADTPGGEPGNDDLGAMSSWLAWAYLGVYPETPGAPVLVLGAPVFSRATLHLANGRQVVISAPGASTRSYVAGLTIDGTPWTRDWVPVSRFTGPSGAAQAAGGSTTLAFTMRDTPDRSWAASADDEPPSFAAGPITLPGAGAHPPRNR